VAQGERAIGPRDQALLCLGVEMTLLAMEEIPKPKMYLAAENKSGVDGSVWGGGASDCGQE
jgi:hypothetical protein